MKWGVRNDKYSLSEKKALRKRIKSDRNRMMSEESYQNRKRVLFSDYYNNYEKNQKEAKKLRREAMNLAKKYDFDADDGGGGSTKASQKAGKKYMQLWDKVAELEEEPYYSRASHAKYVEKELLKKYGQEKMDAAYDTPLWNLGKAYANIGSKKH